MLLELRRAGYAKSGDSRGVGLGDASVNRAAACVAAKTGRCANAFSPGDATGPGAPERPSPPLATTRRMRPQLFVFNGDLVYGDCNHASCPELQEAWASLFEHETFRRAKAEQPMVGILDDHDYGQNDCHAANPYKEFAKARVQSGFG